MLVLWQHFHLCAACAPPFSNVVGDPEERYKSGRPDRQRFVRGARSQSARIAVAGDILLARSAGRIPPTNPITAAKATPRANSIGVTAKWKVISLNVNQFVVPVARPLRGRTPIPPTMPPPIASSTASVTNDNAIDVREKPSARSTATSRPRDATAAYMVFIAAKAEPTAMMIAMTLPRMRTGVDDLVCSA